MSESNHTPGPWEFDPENYGVCNHPGYGILDANRDSLRVTVHERDLSGRVYSSAASNARLIAAAPDLLEACKLVVEYYPAFEHLGDCEARELSAIAIKTCHAAIAKATGTSATVGGGQ